MKKLILCMVFVFATSLAINANSGLTDNKITTEPEVTEEVGCASDCVRAARTLVLVASAILGEDPNDHIDDYLDIYHDCYYSNCV